MSEAAADESMQEGGEDTEEMAPAAILDELKVVHVEAAHRSVDISIPQTPDLYAKLGYFITWTCEECGISRVPGAPFTQEGDKRVFLDTCTFGDTSRVCCNCERVKEVLSWRGRMLKVVREGPKLLDPPKQLVDVESKEVVWDKAEHGNAMYKEITREGIYSGSNAERTRWYSEMAMQSLQAQGGAAHARGGCEEEGDRGPHEDDGGDLQEGQEGQEEEVRPTSPSRIRAQWASSVHRDPQIN
eukprot:CAMPEP_0114147156 /NCGR_PEP_ID=MMETSP0043_2-20121206/20941_1 /TAXON_ID=464988 /ORGANISM="Hemiselmis andersenii, Strain CCMP644" /LENGTH=242 /DNA_ID=CAMNT_0001241645 /DNA_START=19 /DNA_END=743 /DNA_ORIENTATION=-